MILMYIYSVHEKNAGYRNFILLILMKLKYLYKYLKLFIECCVNIKELNTYLAKNISKRSDWNGVWALGMQWAL